MGNYRHQVSLQSVSGLPEDKAINVFHSVAADQVAASAFALEVAQFYANAHTGQTNALGKYLGDSVSRVALAHTVKSYDLADAEPRTPFSTVTFTMPAALATSINFPREVAACLSFKGAPVSGEPAARRRGRIYLGPLRAETSGEGGSGEMYLVDPFIADLKIAAVWLLGSSNATWSIYSPTDDAMVEIVSGWIDNAFDTQRRRGQDASTRTVWP